MKKWQKITLGLSLSAVLICILAAYAIYNRVIYSTIPDCYAQWATAELILAHRRSSGSLPKHWSDLKKFESEARHHGGLNFDEIRARIKIDFASLPRLEIPYLSENDIPKVILTVSGRQVYWSGAEPNFLVNYELLNMSKPADNSRE